MPTRSSGCTTAWSARCSRRSDPSGTTSRRSSRASATWAAASGASTSTSTRASRCWSLTSTCTSTGRGGGTRCSSAPCRAPRAHPPLHDGDRLNHAAYESIKTDLQRTAATYGYLEARLIRNELVVDPPNHKANIGLELDTGQRYYFGATSIRQDVVREPLVRRYLRYHE